MEYTITKDNFEKEVLQSEKPVIIDFWATWCGPCMMMAPIVKSIADEHPEWKIGKINVDEEPDLARAYQIASIPTFMLFRDGKLVASALGYSNKDVLLSKLGL